MLRRASLSLSLLVLATTTRVDAQARATTTEDEPSYADVSTPAPRLDVAGESYGAISVLVHSGEYVVSSGGMEVTPGRVASLPVTMPIATLTAARRSERGHTLQLSLEANDELLFVGVSRHEGRMGGIVTLVLGGAAALGTGLIIGTTTTCSPGVFGGSDCARPVTSAVVGAIGGALALAAGLILLAQPDATHLDIRGARGIRRTRPHARGNTIAPAVLLGLHGIAVLGVLPAVFLQEPTAGVPEPWNLLAPSMTSMLMTPLLVTLAGELGGGHGAAWAAYVGSLAGWLGMAITQIIVEEIGSSSTGVPAMIVGSALSLGGALLGYALSDQDDERVEGEGLLPTFAIGPQGASVGVVGTM